MIDIRNKMKKKRKVNDATAEVHVKKKKSKNNETDEISCPVSKTPAVDSQESIQVNGKEKVKKKKRKFTEALESSIPSVDEKPEADGENALTSSKIQNAVAIEGNETNINTESEAPEASVEMDQAQRNDKKREKKKKRKLNPDVASDKKATQNGHITAGKLHDSKSTHFDMSGICHISCL